VQQAAQNTHPVTSPGIIQHGRRLPLAAHATPGADAHCVVQKGSTKKDDSSTNACCHSPSSSNQAARSSSNMQLERRRLN